MRKSLLFLWAILFAFLPLFNQVANGLGGDASVAAGPVGRDASADTDATLRSKILSYSRARDLFAGVFLEGSTIRPGNGDNERLYGRKIPAREIVLSGTVAVPSPAQELISTLDTTIPSHRP